MKTKILKHHGLFINNSSEGNTIEQYMRRVIENKESISNVSKDLIYTERKEGVRASTNIRTDRFEIALDATEKIAKSYKARREDYHKPKTDNGKTDNSKTDNGKTDNGKTDANAA